MSDVNAVEIHRHKRDFDVFKHSFQGFRKLIKRKSRIFQHNLHFVDDIDELIVKLFGSLAFDGFDFVRDGFRIFLDFFVFQKSVKRGDVFLDVLSVKSRKRRGYVEYAFSDAFRRFVFKFFAKFV